MEPQSTDQLLRQARNAVQAGELGQGLRLGREAAETAPGSLEAWQLIARCAWKTGQYELAVEAFGEEARIAPGPTTSARLIQTHIALARFEEAHAASRAAADRWPEDPMTVLYAGLAALDQGDRDLARYWLERGLRLAPGVFPVQMAHWTLDPGQPPPSASAPERIAAQAEGLAYIAERCAPGTLVPYTTRVLQRALQQAPAEGAIIECGVFWGRTLRLLAEWSGRPVHGFDSFEGLPEAWKADEGRGAYSTEGQIPELPQNVTLHPGWFEESLPDFGRTVGDIALLHIDCDIYSSTRTVLEHLGPGLKPGSVVVFDDYLGYPGWREHEFRAWQEYGRERGIDYRYVAAAVPGREVAVRIESVG